MQVTTKKLGGNVTLVSVFPQDGTEGYDILVSYETPVVVRYHKTGRFCETDVRWSSSTMRQMSKYHSGLHYPPRETIGQDELDALLRAAIGSDRLRGKCVSTPAHTRGITRGPKKGYAI